MNYQIKQVEWAEEQAALSKVRLEVFVDEQKVPLEEEIDGLDPECQHFLAVDQAGEAIACARLLPNGQIGRIAVVKSWRGTGLGAEIVTAVMDYAKQENIDNLHLHSQTYAIGFYERLGFTAEGPEFLDAGIPHRNMIYTN